MTAGLSLGTATLDDDLPSEVPSMTSGAAAPFGRRGNGSELLPPQSRAGLGVDNEKLAQ